MAKLQELKDERRMSANPTSAPLVLTAINANGVLCVRCSAPILPSESGEITMADPSVTIENQPASPRSIIVVDAPVSPVSRISDCSTLMSAFEPPAFLPADESTNGHMTRSPESQATRHESNSEVLLLNAEAMVCSNQSAPYQTPLLTKEHAISSKKP